MTNAVDGTSTRIVLDFCGMNDTTPDSDSKFSRTFVPCRDFNPRSAVSSRSVGLKPLASTYSSIARSASNWLAVKGFNDNPPGFAADNKL
jgi:hypothetical protein